jgi:pimeloyl-ACP methyl ester carboxylesterase/O-acetyl-ADP-ribose deacetylase (regulator of RNase III)
VRKGLAIFVHGLFSSSKTWDPLVGLLSEDSLISDNFNFLAISYPSNKLRFNILRRIPDIGSIADRLRIEIDHYVDGAERIALVGHSMGGLIILRYLTKMIADQKGLDLRRARSVVMLATPNDGSDIFRVLREHLWLRHPQELELRRFNQDVTEARLRVRQSVVDVSDAAIDRCPIPIAAYAGEADNVVKFDSARSFFQLGGTLPGDHFTIHRPTDRNQLVYKVVRKHLIDALEAPLPPVAQSYAGRSRDDVYTEIHAFPAVSISISGQPVLFQLHAGPINQVRQVDIIVASENIYYDIAKPFKPSTSGRLRFGAARKNAAGDIEYDTILEEINKWMHAHNKHGLSVTKGTVAPTSSGELSSQGVKRIYHVAIVEPRLGSNEYDVSMETISRGVHNVFELARREREAGMALTSIGFPLFGAGRGRLNYEISFQTMWEALKGELTLDPSWAIHFCTWEHAETDYVVEQLRHFANA